MSDKTLCTKSAGALKKLCLDAEVLIAEASDFTRVQNQISTPSHLSVLQLAKIVKLFKLYLRVGENKWVLVYRIVGFLFTSK